MRSRRVLASSALGIAAAAILAYGAAGVIRVWQMKQDVEALGKELETLQSETELLSSTVDRLREDPALIEKLAREELGYVKPGEKVLKFPPMSGPEAPPRYRSPSRAR
ncbi:MAG: septum formation initiator family protein [Candidatus Methylomirabilia bacterium]